MDFHHNERKGQGLIEYALIMVLVVLVGMIGLFFLGPSVKQTYAKVMCHMEGVGGDPGCYYFLEDQSSVGNRQVVVTWTEAPGALRYDVETRTWTCQRLNCSSFRGDTFEAGDICRNGTCSAVISPWYAGRYVTIRAYGSKGTRTILGEIPSR